MAATGKKVVKNIKKFAFVKKSPHICSDIYFSTHKFFIIMSRILKIAGITLLAILLILFGLGYKNSGPYNISRSKDISASPEQVYKVIGDYNKWNSWSPWGKLDPNQTFTVTGQAGTVGHRSEWKGNDQVGSGNMTIIEVKPNEYIKEELVFTAPQQSKCKANLFLKANGSKTNVTWEMSGESGVMEGIFLAFMGGMDKMMGKDFEKGLENLDKVAAQEVVAPIVN